MKETKLLHVSRVSWFCTNKHLSLLSFLYSMFLSDTYEGRLLTKIQISTSMSLHVKVIHGKLTQYLRLWSHFPYRISIWHTQFESIFIESNGGEGNVQERYPLISRTWGWCKWGDHRHAYRHTESSHSPPHRSKNNSPDPPRTPQSPGRSNSPGSWAWFSPLASRIDHWGCWCRPCCTAGSSRCMTSAGCSMPPHTKLLLGRTFKLKLSFSRVFTRWKFAAACCASSSTKLTKTRLFFNHLGKARVVNRSQASISTGWLQLLDRSMGSLCSVRGSSY